MEEPKKRRLRIVDAVSDETTGPAIPKPLPPPPEPTAVTPGHVHQQAQQEILRLCEKADFSIEKIEDRIWLKLDKVLKTKTLEEAQLAAKEAVKTAEIFFLLGTKTPETQAKTAERIAKMHRNKGNDEEADKQAAKAKQIRTNAANKIAK